MIDLILDTAKGTIPIKIKSGQTISENFFKGLNYFDKLIGKNKNYDLNGLIIGKDYFKKHKSTQIVGYNSVYKIFDLLNP